MKYRIDPKVWKKIIGRSEPTLPRVMFAAALDPLLIHDLDKIPEPRSLIECVRLADMGTRGDLRDYLRGVLSEWVLDQPDARSAANAIAYWDQRVGVWISIFAAELALIMAPQREQRPAIAIQAATDWLYGNTSDEEAASICGRSAQGAIQASYDALDVPAIASAARAAACTAYAAMYAANASASQKDLDMREKVTFASHVVCAFDNAASSFSTEYEEDADDATVSRYFRDTIADAIMQYPLIGVEN
jgi:hypothetical protein